MRRKVRRLQVLGPVLLLCALALIAGLGAGCLDKPTTPVIRPLAPPPLPVNPDSLIVILRNAYTRMDIDTYRSLLRADFVFKFLQYDIDNLGLPADHLTRQEDLVSTSWLFSGSPVGDVPAVALISWPVLEAIGTWEASANPEFLGAMHRIYNFEINIARPGATTMIIMGQQEFYVTSRDTTIDGTLTPYWELLGQIDLSDHRGGKGIQGYTWGEVKALYLPREE